MTIKEAIEDIRDGIKPIVGGKSLEIAIECMEEVEQYRALEEKLNGISVEHIVNAFIERVEKYTNEGYEKGRILTNAEADMWEQYRALGTVEELKEAREKQIPKKPKMKKREHILHYECPSCGFTTLLPHCGNCGQKIDWEEGGISD